MADSDEPLDPCFLDQLELLLNSNDQRLIKILDKRGYIIKYTPEDVYNFAEVGDVDKLRTALLLEDNTTNWFLDDHHIDKHGCVALHRAAENGHLECGTAVECCS